MNGEWIPATASTSDFDTNGDTSFDYDGGSYTQLVPTDDGGETVNGTYAGTTTLSATDTETSRNGSDDQQGAITSQQITTSDQTATESSTESVSGSDTFSGIEEDGSDYWGSGSFTENAFASTTLTSNDDSDTTIDACGRLNGTISSSDYKSFTWNDNRQDVDSISTTGDEDEPDTRTDQESGTQTNQVDVLTSYTEGTPTEQGGSTLQTTGTDSISDTDPDTMNASRQRKVVKNASGQTTAVQNSNVVNPPGPMTNVARAAGAAVGAANPPALTSKLPRRSLNSDIFWGTYFSVLSDDGWFLYGTQYAVFRQGCIGLAELRLGVPYAPDNIESYIKGG